MSIKKIPAVQHEPNKPFRWACILVFALVCAVGASLFLPSREKAGPGDNSAGRAVSGAENPDESSAPFAEPQEGPSSSEASGEAPGGASAQAPVERAYILNKNTHKFHDPACPSIGQMNESNKLSYTGTEEALLAMGYTPCKRCGGGF